MPGIEPREFKRPGTLDYVLVASGLITVTTTREHDVIAAAPALTAQFPPGQVLPIDEIVPALRCLILDVVYQRSNFLDGASVRAEAIHVFNRHRVLDGGIAKMYEFLRQGAEVARADLARCRLMIR
ncbi:hypothetical protein [Limnoglobus roseus]|uniref:Uncharacterized protein n=1 Tax=Limnoglobus roseus TaxID=2598579 RepID=A0A5C1AA36_9BACT|nr:hypothetical protein [Limnoglobus roseus]QEL16249.1 hypothetical protein PX52LOC_03189 [Limnoglobus roseus]